MMLTNWVGIVLWAAALAAGAYFDVATKWLIVAAFVGVTATLCAAIRVVLHRLTLSVSFLEQTTSELRKTVEDINWRTPA